jgi:hypothetical protein
MKDVVSIGCLGLAFAGLFIIAMANPVVGFLCLLPIFVATQK